MCWVRHEKIGQGKGGTRESDAAYILPHLEPIEDRIKCDLSVKYSTKAHVLEFLVSSCGGVWDAI